MVSGGAGRIRLGGAGHPRRRVRACSGVRFLRHNRERRPPGRHRCAKRRERRVPRSRPDDAERRGPCREANHPRTRGPSLPPACGGLCRPGGRRSLAWASLSTVAWGREANHPRTRGPSLPPACGGLCRPGGRRSLACASLCTVAWSREANHPELGVLPCRPPAAGCADLEVGVPWPGRHSPRWRGAERRTTPKTPGTNPNAIPPPHDTDDHGQSSGRSQSPAFTGLFRI